MNIDPSKILEQGLHTIFKVPPEAGDPGICQVTTMDWELKCISLKDARGRSYYLKFDEVEIWKGAERGARHAGDGTVTFMVEATMKERWAAQFLGMLQVMQQLGNEGSTREVTLMADGDGDFQPKFRWGAELITTPAHLLITGNPCDGFTFIGPFGDNEQAGDYAVTHTKDNWWLAETEAPDPEFFDQLPNPAVAAEITGRGFIFDAG